MSDLQRSGGRRMTRKQRESRAFQFVVAGGVTGALGVVGLLLAIVTSFSAFWPIVLLLIAVGCVFGFKRTVE